METPNSIVIIEIYPCIWVWKNHKLVQAFLGVLSYSKELICCKWNCCQSCNYYLRKLWNSFVDWLKFAGSLSLPSRQMCQHNSKVWIAAVHACKVTFDLGWLFCWFHAREYMNDHMNNPCYIIFKTFAEAESISCFELWFRVGMCHISELYYKIE
jgi:hypothetical protein